MVGTEGRCADDGGGGGGDGGGVAFSDDGEDVGAGEVVFELAVFVVLGVGGLAGECVSGGWGGVRGDGDGGGGCVGRGGKAVVGAVRGGGAGGLVRGVGSGGGAEVAATNRGCCGGGLILQRFVCAVV